MEAIINHPLIPNDINVSGFIKMCIRDSFRLVKCVDVGHLLLQGDILESTRLFVQQIQSGTCPNPHVSVILFCNGGDGIYSGIQTDGIQGQIEALQIIEPVSYTHLSRSLRFTMYKYATTARKR